MLVTADARPSKRAVVFAGLPIHRRAAMTVAQRAVRQVRQAVRRVGRGQLAVPTAHLSATRVPRRKHCCCMFVAFVHPSLYFKCTLRFGLFSDLPRRLWARSLAYRFVALSVQCGFVVKRGRVTHRGTQGESPGGARLRQVLPFSVFLFRAPSEESLGLVVSQAFVSHESITAIR